MEIINEIYFLQLSTFYSSKLKVSIRTFLNGSESWKSIPNCLRRLFWLAPNACVCDVAGIGGQMKEARLICPTTPKLSHDTERCLKPKLRISTSPRNVTYTLLAACSLSRRTQRTLKFLISHFFICLC